MGRPDIGMANLSEEMAPFGTADVLAVEKGRTSREQLFPLVSVADLYTEDSRSVYKLPITSRYHLDHD